MSGPLVYQSQEQLAAFGPLLNCEYLVVTQVL